jgi:predicted nucleic acid-binding protein
MSRTITVKVEDRILAQIEAEASIRRTTRSAVVRELSEAFFLLRQVRGGHDRLAALLDRGVVEVRFDFQDERDSVLRLLRKHSDTPMSFADACLVRMSELHRDTRILTLDRDFDTYRRNGRERIPLLAPW